MPHMKQQRKPTQEGNCTFINMLCFQIVSINEYCISITVCISLTQIHLFRTQLTSTCASRLLIIQQFSSIYQQ